MSLARSASGPGGLSINTGVANSIPNAQSAQSGSLFGSASNTAAAAPASATGAPTTGAAGANNGGGMASTGGLFGSGAASAGGAQQKPGGLFGNSTATNTQANTGAGGGLFGNAQQSNQTQQASGGGGGLFGGGAQQQQNTQQPQQGGGLFGNAQQNNQQNQQQSAGGGLFGNAGNQQQQQQPQQQQTGGLFGASTTNNQQNTQGATGGGLFGASQAKPSLFAQTQPQQQQQQQQPQQQSNQVPAVQINYDNVRPRTRFDDLAKPVQEQIHLVDKGITRVMKMKDEIGEFMPQHERDIEQLGRDVKFVESKYRTVRTALNNDIQAVKTLQDITKKNIADAQLSFKATDNLKLPAHYHATGLFIGSGTGAAGGAGGSGTNASTGGSGTHADAQDLITYFNRICDDVEKYKRRLDEYRGEIERDMPGVENGLYEQIRTLRDRHAASSGGDGSGGISDQLGQVLLALREMGTAIVNQAGQIADTRERLSRLQAGILDSGVYAMGMAA